MSFTKLTSVFWILVFLGKAAFAGSSTLLLAVDPTMAALQVGAAEAALAATRAQNRADLAAQLAAANPDSEEYALAAQITAGQAQVAAQRAQLLQQQVLAAQAAIAQAQANTGNYPTGTGATLPPPMY